MATYQMGQKLELKTINSRDLNNPIAKKNIRRMLMNQLKIG